MKKGKVYLAGAGPGDCALLTLKARELLENADVVIFDHLVGYAVLDYINTDAEIIYAGKSNGRHILKQHEINALLVKKANEGKTVVRLKGGDPFLFGRGGEELEELAKNNIDFEAVPGVSSISGVPAYFGIPVTHRASTSSLYVVSACNNKDGPAFKSIDWSHLAKTKATIVFLMAVSKAPEISEELISHGMNPDTKCAVCENGTTAKQRYIETTLNDLSKDINIHNIHPPALIITGDVLKYRDAFSWYEKRPLAGLRIAVTRPGNRAAHLLKLLRDNGAEAVNLPVIQTKAKPCPEFKKTIHELCSKKGVAVFTSPRGAEVFFDNLAKERIDIRLLSGVDFAVTGSATESVLKSHNIYTDLMPEVFSIDSLTALLIEKIKPERKIFLFRSSIGSRKINIALEKANRSFYDIALYDTLPVKTHPVFYADSDYQNKFLSSFDMFIFCSGSTVDAFIETFSCEMLQKQNIISIGEDTRASLQKQNIKSSAAKNATMEEIVQVVLSALLKSSGSKIL